MVPVGGVEIAPLPKTATETETENFVRLYHHRCRTRNVLLMMLLLLVAAFDFILLIFFAFNEMRLSAHALMQSKAQRTSSKLELELKLPFQGRIVSAKGLGAP